MPGSDRKHHHDRIEAILAASGEGFWTVDSEGRLKDANAAYCRMSGFTREELERLHVSEIDVLETPRETQERIRRIIANGTELFQTRHRRKDGSTFDVEVSVSYLENEGGELICFCRDITDRVRSEALLRESEATYRTLFNSIRDAILVVGPDRKIRDCNAAFTELFGYTRDEVFGSTTALIFQSESDYLNLGQRMRADDGVSGFLYEVQYRKKNGEVFLGEKRVQHLYDDEGNPNGFIGLVRDISDRAAAERRIRELLQEKELLMHEMHHRIKNNMNTMASLLALQASRMDNPDAAVALNDAESRMTSMQVLYDRLYRSDSMQELTLDSYLPPLVEEILRLFPNRSRVEVVFRLESITLDVRSLSPIGIICNELITNTMKHAFTGRAGGTLTISAVSKGAQIVLTVEDDGVGVPEDVVIGSKEEGFGLMLVQALAQQLYGEVRIERDEGTRVVLEFDAPPAPS
jgi:PAS domain S-box-containing protein